MRMHKVRVEFMRHNRLYRVGLEYSFEEWPDETRNEEIEELIQSGKLEVPEEPEQPQPSAARSTHKNVRSAAADVSDDT